MNVKVATCGLIFAIVLLAAPHRAWSIHFERLPSVDVIITETPDLILPLKGNQLIISPHGNGWRLYSDPELVLTDRNKSLISFKVNNTKYNVIGLSFLVGADHIVEYTLLKLSRIIQEFPFASRHETIEILHNNDDILRAFELPNSDGLLKEVDACIRQCAAQGFFPPQQKSLASPRQKPYNQR